jgi:UDP-N-acetylglucosamine--N-acetylmuramyl-(pentapeptide) pyrophosphoryl-undecaprenol N-acetylglucosamine transferase
MYKLVFTGGHHNSALSLAKEIRRTGRAEIVWFGHKHSIIGDKNPSAEYLEVVKSGIKFRELVAGKVYRTLNLLHWLRLPWGFFQAYLYLLQERPDLVVSFGGYLAAPVVFGAWLQGIPIVTHEQTIVVGFANKFISHFADKIFVTWPQSKQYFPSQKVILTGLPLRESIFNTPESEKFFENKLPTVYITGGKQGSHVLNMAVLDGLADLLKETNIIHQTGSNSVTNDYEKLEQARKGLPKDLQKRYIVRPYIFADEIGTIFQQADLVVTRAGAHIVYELAALGLPALFVPIPWVSHNEQYKNARLLVNSGSASILPEDRLNAQTLLAELKKMLEKKDYYRKQAQTAKLQVILNANERISNGIFKILEEKSTKIN